MFLGKINASRASSNPVFLCSFPKLAASGKFPRLGEDFSSSTLKTYPFMSHKLENYLRTHRKRAGLSQDDVAFLLGTESESKVSRYERFARQPNLETALAFKAIFGVPIQELFAGLYQKVEQTTQKRALLLTKRLSAANPNPAAIQKLTALKALSAKAGSKPTNFDGTHPGH